MRNVHKILAGNPEEYKPHGRRLKRWKNNITIDSERHGM
jgi:hypothetical protein